MPYDCCISMVNPCHLRASHQDSIATWIGNAVVGGEVKKFIPASGNKEWRNLEISCGSDCKLMRNKHYSITILTKSIGLFIAI